MINILFPFVFYSKVVDDEGERNGTGSVFPKSRSVLSLVVTVGGKTFSKKFVGKDAGLRESPNCFSYLEVDEAAGNLL